jgi:hypothetical protein
VLGFAACDSTDDARRSEKNPGSTAPLRSPSERREAKVSRATLIWRRRSRLNNYKHELSTEEQPRTADLDVEANADKNEVTISGTVQSQEQRNTAIELAKSTGVTVNDKIDVKPAS